MRDNNISVAALQAGRAQTRSALDQLALLADFACDMDGRSRRQPQRRTGADAAFAHLDDDGHLRSVRAGVTAARSGKDVGDGRSPHVKADCTGEITQYCSAAAIADGELSCWKLFWSQLEPKSGGTTS